MIDLVASRDLSETTPRRGMIAALLIVGIILLALGNRFFLKEKEALLAESIIPASENSQISAGRLSDSAASQVFLPLVLASNSFHPGPGTGSWAMAGANPERTSWTSEEVRGKLRPLWYKPFEPYIIQKVQIVAEYGMLYISTSRGLYALDADTGAERWVYPTELPLGHSPTVVDGVVYVGGFDHRLHAIDAYTGERLWTFRAGAGFDTNPLVAEGKVFAGNRDGFFYAIHAAGSSAGRLAWKYKTQGPILYSAAYKDGVVYFASNDSRAYALDAKTGGLVWRSAKLPGAGFHSWWPVIYGDVVIFSGSNNYRTAIGPGPASQFSALELDDVYPHHRQDPRGTLVGPLGMAAGLWVDGTPTIDASRPNVTSNGSTVPITEYFESKPWRRTYFVLDRYTGKEVTYDFDRDGKAEYAPILWLGTHSGNRFPPVVGSDGILYQGNNYKSDPTIAGGHISGWMLGTPYLSIVNNDWNAVDEPVAMAGGGDLIYWNRCCDRVGGAFDISIPESEVFTGTPAQDRKWNYFSYNLPSLVPGYNIMTYVSDPYDAPWGGVYGGRNGSYGFHGDVNPPIPYDGKVFMHRSNAIIAFSPDAGQPTKLPLARIAPGGAANIPALSDAQLKALLSEQVEKILNTGHLRPGYASTGLFDLAGVRICGPDLVDYWHSPADTIYTLLRALPYLPADLQSRTRTYLQQEFNTYPLYEYEHIGWRDGAPREVFISPPEFESARANAGPEREISNFAGWRFSPFSFYALWKYAEVFGGAKPLFDAAKNRLESPPADDVLLKMPFVHNAYLAGYWGFLELEKMAGYPETSQVRNELNRLLSLRASSFTFEAPDEYFQGIQVVYCRNLNTARNFMFLVPEVAQYLREHALSKVRAAVTEFERVTPYWFVPKSENAFAEGVLNQLYDYNALFQAKALILQESRSELTKYLDVPAFAVGDLFYIQNLVSLLESD